VVVCEAPGTVEFLEASRALVEEAAGDEAAAEPLPVIY
jgi:hypothetical protein